MSQVDITIVSPIYNEEKLIQELISNIRAALDQLTRHYEIILVDDGSFDSSFEQALEIHRQDNRIKVIQLSRNYGHQAAYTAGLTYATGNFIGLVDGDLQDPPQLFVDMYHKIQQENKDIIFAIKKTRQENGFKRLFFKFFHFIFQRLTGIPANSGNFSLMKKEVLTSFLGLKEKNRYLPGLLFSLGFRQSYIYYDRESREEGEAMSINKLLKLALDAVYSFSNIPIKLCLFLGVIGLVISLIATFIVVIKKITGDAITGWTSILLSIYLFGSIQLLFLGILGEYIFRTYTEVQDRPIFLIRKIYD